MPEQQSFPDLARRAAEATQPPPFDVIVARAHRHRRRTVLATSGAVAAVVIAVAAGAALTTGETRSAPGPAGPSRSTGTSPSPAPGQAADPDEVVRDGRLTSVAVTAKGSLLTVWQRCVGEGQRCRTAWQLQGHSAGITRALVPGNFVSATAAGDSVVVTSWDQPGVVVGDDGSSRPLRAVGVGTVAPGDAVVRLGKRLVVVDPATASYWPLAVPAGVEGWVHGEIAADGTVWAMPFIAAPPIDVRVSWLPPSDGATWQHHPISSSFGDGPSPGLMAVANDHVAALSMHDGVDVATYGRMAVTTDGGASWSDLRPGDLPFDNVDAMAATSGGTLYVASTDRTGEARVYRSTDSTWQHFAEVPGARGTYRLVAAGPRVVATRGPLTGPEVLRLDDAGHATSWAEFR